MNTLDEAVQAAHGAICEQNIEDCLEWRGKCVKSVEAAAPYIVTPKVTSAISAEEIESVADMLKAAKADGWDEGVKAGADYQFKLAHSIEHDTPEEPGPIINPYRSQA